MVIWITGASGLIGSAVADDLRAAGHRVVRLVRTDRHVGRGCTVWDPATGIVRADATEPVEAVIHLAGKSIASGRWSAAFCRALYDSRIGPTQRLAEFLAGLSPPPRVFLGASATGFYGDTGDRFVDETDGPGGGFLAPLCRDWEAACDPLKRTGVRVVHLRFGPVISSHGGFLRRMLPPFRLGLGGPLGDGRQWLSWVALDDVVHVVRFVLEHETISGPVNVVSPGAVTNRQFARALGRVLRRPAVLPLPAWMLRLLVGRMADEVLLSSCRAIPSRLLDAGFEFQEPELASALARCLSG